MTQRLIALTRKEFIQIGRDRRTLTMMILLPLIWLVMFGYAFNFDIQEMRVAVVDQSGTWAGELVAGALRGYERFRIVELPEPTEADIRAAMGRNELQMGVIIPPGFGEGTADRNPRMAVLVDGAELFSAQAAVRLLQQALEPVQDRLRAELEDRVRAQVRRRIEQAMAEAITTGRELPVDGFRLPLLERLDPTPPAPPEMIPRVEILYNPDLKTATVMIPGLLGMVTMFMTTLMTAMGIVREREYGTLEQLVVTPLRPVELMLGKLLPYVLIAMLDFALVFLAGTYLFGLTFAGNLPVFLGMSLLFLLTTLGLGLVISTLAQNQQQAMQLAFFVIFPQILLSGLIFPLSSMPKAIQGIAYLLPFTYYVPIARGMFIKGQELALLAQPALLLVVYAVSTVTLASLRFRKRSG